VPLAHFSPFASSTTTASLRPGSGSGVCVPPGNGGDQLMCDNSFGRAGSLRSWMVNPPSRHAAYPRSPAVIMWCSATRRPGGHVGLSPAARFMPGSHQRVAQVYMTALADQLGAGRGSYPLTDGHQRATRANAP
jgi:hypothetical protein